MSVEKLSTWQEHELGVQLDAKWVGVSFLLSNPDLKKAEAKWRTYTTANDKYTDASLGGNFSINPPPQFTRRADPRCSGRSMSQNQKNPYINLGQGQYYSEAIDDNAKRIYMRFGVPEFNGLLSFFTNFYNYDQALLANRGRGDSMASWVLRTVATVALLPFWPIVSFVKWAAMDPASQYYYFRPAMHMYWLRANYIASVMAVNRRVVPTVNLPIIADESKGSNPRTPVSAKPDEYNDYAFKVLGTGDAMNGFFKKGGGIDLFYLAGRAQRMAQQNYIRLKEVAEGTSDYGSLRDKMLRYQAEKLSDKPGTFKSLEEYIKAYFGDPIADLAHNEEASAEEYLRNKTATALNEGGAMPQSQGAQDAAAANAPPPAPKDPNAQASGNAPAPAPTNPDPNAQAANGNSTEPKPATAEQAVAVATDLYNQRSFRDKWKFFKGKIGLDIIPGWGTLSKTATLLHSEMQDGSQWVCFHVQYSPGTSTSFSNQTKSSGIEDSFNSASGSAREARVNFSDGQTGINALDSAWSGIKEVLGEGLATFGLDGLLAMAGSAFVDIPQVWENSSTTWPTTNYRLQLRPWCNHPLAIYLYQDVPICMLLAAALPASTGVASYTSPMLVQLFDPGVSTVRLGMITSLTINRGTGNVSWSKEVGALGADVDFEITNLSRLLHAPIDPSFNFLEPWKNIVPDDNNFNDYLAAMANLSVADQTAIGPRMALAFTRGLERVDNYFSAGRLASYLRDLGPGRIISSPFDVPDRVLFGR